MANEIKVTTQIECTNGNFRMPKVGAQNTSVNQGTAGGMVPGVVSVTTSDTALTLSVGTLGWAFIQNLDATNWVNFGPASGGSIVPALRLNPNEPGQLVRLVPGTTYRVQANTATCKVLILVLEN